MILPPYYYDQIEFRGLLSPMTPYYTGPTPYYDQNYLKFRRVSEVNLPMNSVQHATWQPAQAQRMRLTMWHVVSLLEWLITVCGHIIGFRLEKHIKRSSHF